MRRFTHSVPRQWSPTQVPTWPVEVIEDHPLGLAGGLVALYVPGSPAAFRDLAEIGQALIPQSGASLRSSPIGPGLSNRAANTAANSTFIPAALKTTTAMSLFWKGIYDGSQSGNNVVFGVQYDAANDAPFDCYTTFISGSNFHAFYNSGVSSFFDVAGNSPLSIGVTSGAATFEVGGAINVYVDAILTGTASWSGGAPNYDGPAIISFGNDPGSASLFPNVTHCIGAAYGTALPATLVAWLNAEPFAMLRPKMRRAYFTVSSSIPFNAAPGPGLIALSGLVPSVSAAASLAPGAGTITIAGNVPVVSAAFATTPSSGLISLSGAAPTLAASASFVPGAGLIGISGTAPSISATAALTAGLGTIVLSGLAPSVSGDADAFPGSGSILLTGFAPTISAGYFALPGAGNVVFAGKVPIVSTGSTPIQPSPQRTIYAPGGVRIVSGGRRISALSAPSPGRTIKVR